MPRASLGLMVLLIAPLAFGAHISVQLAGQVQIEKLRLDALRGQAEAQYRFAQVPGQDRVAWLAKAARQGHGRAMYDLGAAYHSGAGVARDNRKAIDWLEKAAARRQADAWLLLGYCHARGGYGIVQDQARAAACFEQADRLGDPQIWHDLGNVYRHGNQGLEWDWDKAFRYYSRAAERGHAESQYALGQCYEAGIGVEASMPQALAWMKKAAAGGQAWCAWNLGERYEAGKTVPRDLDQANAYFDLAAKHSPLHAGWRDFLKSPTPVPAADAPLEEKLKSTDDIVLTLAPEKDEYEIDEPMLIHMVWQNVGKQPYSHTVVSWRDQRGWRQHFWVTDEKGKTLSNPYEEPQPRISFGGGRVGTQVFEPGKETTKSHLLNLSVHLDKPGTYTILTNGYVYAGKGRGPDRNDDYLAVKIVPAKITVKPCDPKRRRADILELMRAYQNQRGIPNRFPLDGDQYGAKLDLVRYLAIYREPQLIQFFLDVIEEEDGNGYAATALRAMADRAAVLRAFEERLDHPERFHTLNLLHPYLRLCEPVAEPALLPTDDPIWWKREHEIRRKYRRKALEVVKADRHYRYARLAQGLLGGNDNLVLIDYLLRCEPNRPRLEKSAAVLQNVKLEPRHIPYLTELLNGQTSMPLADALIFQLVRLDRGKFRHKLESDPARFSPAMRQWLQDSE